ncbi:MAG: zinc ABC transporter substrate-binding protein [Aestuariivirga sp.]
MRGIAFSLAALFLASPAAAAPKVIASILPVHSIVSAVMGETGKPELLLSGRMSEHKTSFSAAQISELGRADLVFIVGHGLEAKLAQMSGSEAVGGKHFIELAGASGVRTLGIREGGSWELDEDEPQIPATLGEDGSVLKFDPHVWLDPENAKAMAMAIAAELAKADSANAAVYEANAKRLASDIDAASADISASLASVKDKPFIVFHDAYQYFERSFGLRAVGSISDVSAASPSAQRLKEIRGKLAATGAVCVFREPQFDSKFIDTVIEGSNARPGVLDPLGADLEAGPGAYSQLLHNLASNLKSCLEG